MLPQEESATLKGSSFPQKINLWRLKAQGADERSENHRVEKVGQIFPAVYNWSPTLLINPQKSDWFKSRKKLNI